MVCPRCGSTRVLTQQMVHSELKNAHHSIFWWLLIGWWWVPFKWIFLTVPALLAKIFIPKRQKLKERQYSVCTCQNCAYSWKPTQKAGTVMAPVFLFPLPQAYSQEGSKTTWVVPSRRLMRWMFSEVPKYSQSPIR